jgi:hypothetical protein
MGSEMAIILIIVGLCTTTVWGIVVIILAIMGVRHPEHKNFFLQLARSKKTQIPSMTLGNIGKVQRSDDDKSKK